MKSDRSTAVFGMALSALSQVAPHAIPAQSSTYILVNAAEELAARN